MSLTCESGAGPRGDRLQKEAGRIGHAIGSSIYALR
jgi:hypothetical protein